MQTRKVTIDELRPGMYVAELDRPWAESPFLFQGFTIESGEQLEKLRETCSFVFVQDAAKDDGDKDDDDRTILLSMNVRPASNPNPSRAEWQRIAPGERQTSFQREMQRAATTRQRTRRYVNKLLTDARFGLAIDTEAARELVCDLVEDITENPDTALWLTQLKNVHEYTAQHCINVAVLSIAFAAHLGYQPEQLKIIGLGALLHDVGKMRVPREVLDKPGRVTAAEFEVLKRHVVDGYEMMKATGQLPAQVLQIIRHHHERVSGGGYPDGLRGEQISTAVRVVSICDTYDALTSDRVYRKRILPDQALHAMYQMAPVDFGKELVQEFIRCVGIYPVGSVVQLVSGAVGIVMTKDPQHKLRPVVMLVKDAQGRDYRPRRFISLAGHSEVGDSREWQVRCMIEPEQAGIDMERIASEELLRGGYQVVNL